MISLPADAPDKPYKIRRSGAWVTPIRSGTITRFATREEEQRLYQRGGWLRYGLKPVPGTNLNDLNYLLLRDYLTRVQGGSAPDDEDVIGWERLLHNLDLATPAAGRMVPTVDGMLLFGRNPGRFLPQSGLRAICYPGTEPDYAVRADETIKGPLVPLGSSAVPVIEPGLVDRGWDFVRRHTVPEAWLEGARRQERWEYPEEVLREILVNALVHRDYSITGTDVMLTIFSDRLEIQSPGRLPNTVTTDGMKLGHRYARNQTLANLMRDYGYVDGRGMGIRNKVIPGMRAHNGTEPDLIAEESRFTVRLWKAGQ
ncbi:MAG: transcriptional regulator [Caldilineaceae bacterium SB0664_bin_22]|nr:transcriptional regulator [Caldilineaceae bacterium SB0664_bin_22]